MNRIPAHYSASASLRDGRRVDVRTIRPDDRDTLLREFHRLSAESIRNRFFGIKLDLTPEELEFFTEVDFANHVALVAELEQDPGTRPAGVGRFVRQADAPDRAEMAITVVDELQGHGIGRVLLDSLLDCARRLDIRRLDATVFSSNQRMLRLMQGTGLEVESSARGSICTLSIVL